ncbi:hypothetical protein [Actinoplanes sp. NPDC051851]|uniref:hypothetical protein n=1 Tax=Actinoplanes sp. NPDC051851 TaxID=3154753 RepID=UPI00342FAC00
MPVRLSRRELFAASGLLLAGGAPGAYAALRIVRAVPGPPTVPEILLPPGYTLRHRTASRAELLAFVHGPRDEDGIRVDLAWPGQRIAAVIAGDRRLTLHRSHGRVRVTVPVHRATPAADSPTVQMWSRLSSPASGLYWHVEHNDPNRAAGHWQTVRWPTGETRAVLSWTLAAREILIASGLTAAARRRGHFFALMGFETNNPLHHDNPAHWHLSYYPGATLGAPHATVPHFWLDRRGRTYYNGQDRQGAGRTRYFAGEPAPIRDADGTTVLTTVIHPDGGLDIRPPRGPAYAIAGAAGDFTGRLRILRGGRLWRTVHATDDVHHGRLRLETRGRAGTRRRTYRYDPLTGHLHG